MPDERTSFDLRQERLRLIESRSAATDKTTGSKLSDENATDHDDVDAWIKSVRALKEKRQAEDEARNRQLEEDILRERKARQERRATRSRSSSPVKTFASLANEYQPTQERETARPSATSPPKASLSSPRANVLPFPESQHSPLRTEPDQKSIKGSHLKSSALPGDSSDQKENNIKLAGTPANDDKRFTLRETMEKIRNKNTTSPSSTPSVRTSLPAKPGGSVFSRFGSPDLADLLKRGPKSTNGPSLANVASLAGTSEIDMQPKTLQKLEHMTKSRARRKRTSFLPSNAQERDTVVPGSPTALLETRNDAEKTLDTSINTSSKDLAVATYNVDVDTTKSCEQTSVQPPRRHIGVKNRPSGDDPSWRGSSDRTSVKNLSPPSIVACTQSSTTRETKQEAPRPFTSIAHHTRQSDVFDRAEMDRSKTALSVPNHLLQASRSKPSSPNRITSPELKKSDQSPIIEQYSPNQPIAAKVEVSSRASSPFASKHRQLHSASKSVSSMIGIADIIKSRVDRSRMTPTASDNLVSESKPQDLSIWSLRKHDKNPSSVQDEANVLYEDEMKLLITSAKSEQNYLWVGTAVDDVSEAPLTDLLKGEKFVKVLMGQEPPKFLDLFESPIVVTRSRRPNVKTLYSVRALGQGYTIDELSYSSTSLCSGFVFILKAQTVWIWIGRGSSTGEYQTASQYLKSEDSKIVYTTIYEGQETQALWESFGARESYASSSYWRLKRSLPNYETSFYTVDGDLVVKAEQFSRRSLRDERVHIVDTFFELYIRTNQSSSNAEIMIAITWCKEFCRKLGPTRPFQPIILILCPGSKLPRDLNAIFRSQSDEKSTALRILELNTVETMLHRQKFQCSELESGTVFGIDTSRLDRHIEAKDFAFLMGVEQQAFERMSAAEQVESRARAQKYLMSKVGNGFANS